MTAKAGEYMLDVGEAVAQVLADVRALGTERLPLLEAQGRVLAGDAVSRVTLPPWDNSAMDGYAVRASDISQARADAPALLRVLETVAAGRSPSQRVGAGEATRVMTGAPLPEGADSVVRVEDTDGGTGRVAIRSARDAGKNVRPRGEDLAEGRVALAAGTTLGPAQLGVLAAIGAAHVDVHRAPRVAILTSGDELVELDRFEEAREGKKIVSSNSYTLQALVRAAGGVPAYLGIAADTREAVRSLVERSLGCDLIVTSGGISVGEFDYVRDVLGELGAELKFWRARIRPGGPLGFGLLRGRPWLGLPGNPVSTMVTFELFARPAIRRMRGHRRLFRRPVPVVLEEPLTAHAELTQFLRAVLTARGPVLTARLTGAQGSGILSSMAGANALLIVPPDRPRVNAGETVNAFTLGEDAELADEFAL